MSTIIMSACWPLQGMSAAQKAVLISMADQANDDGVCWPAVGTIAIRTCLSRRAVQDALLWLEAVGVLRRDFRHNKSTSYVLTPSKLDLTKAPASRKRVRGADGAPRAAGAPDANGAPHADSAPGANGAGGADGAPPHAAGAPGGAGGAPPEAHQAHPNRKGTVKEPTENHSRRKAARPDAPSETEVQEACRATWASYSQAYAARYGATPVRNAKVNAHVRQLVARLGRDEAPAVAAWFLRDEDVQVVRRMHDIGLLIASAEAYRTKWATGRQGAAQQPGGKFDPSTYIRTRHNGSQNHANDATDPTIIDVDAVRVA